MKKTKITVVAALLMAAQSGMSAGESTPCRYDVTKFHIMTTITRSKTQTPEQLRLMRDCGIDKLNWFNGVERYMLDLCQQYGISCTVQHQIPAWTGGDGRYAGKMRQMRPLSSYTKALEKFPDHPNIFSFSIADEPSAADYDYLAEVYEHVRKLRPGVLPNVCLYPCYAIPGTRKRPTTPNKQLGTVTYREYVEQYVRKVPGPLIWYDVYPWAWRVTRKQFFETVETVADIAHKCGRDVHVSLQATRYAEPGFTNKVITANMMRFQAYTVMAYGAIGVSLTCWQHGWHGWLDQPISPEGLPTPAYGRFKEAGRDIRGISSKYMEFRNVKTVREQATDGAALLVGEMIARNGSGARARFYVAIDDIEDEHPAVHKVAFDVPTGCDARLFGPRGPLPLAREGDGRVTFDLASNHAAILVVSKKGK